MLPLLPLHDSIFSYDCCVYLYYYCIIDICTCYNCGNCVKLITDTYTYFLVACVLYHTNLLTRQNIHTINITTIIITFIID